MKWAAFALAVLLFTCPAQAQNQVSFSTNSATGGSIQPGWDGGTCNSGRAGAIRYNSSNQQIEFCNGTAWAFLAAGSASCGSPSGLSFTNLTGQSLGVMATNATPATITFSGCSSALSVSVSGGGTPQISVNGGAWTTSGSITSGQTLNVRMTTSGSVSTVLTATVTVNATSTNWTTTTLSGSLKVFRTASTYIGTALGGLSGADALCQSEAGTAGYVGTYKAILSDDSTSAASRLTLSYPIVRATNGATVSTVNLWNGALTTSIHGVGGTTWTGTNANGSIATGLTCNGWTGGTNGQWGFDNSTGTTWVQWTNSACGTALYLYCIQQ